MSVNFFFLFVIYVCWLILQASPDFPVYLPFCVMQVRDDSATIQPCLHFVNIIEGQEDGRKHMERPPHLVFA